MRKIVYGILTMLLAICCFGACDIGKEEDSSSSVESTQQNADVTHIQIMQTEIALTVGSSAQVEVTTSKQNVYIFWSVRDEHIATVSDEGVLTGVSEGQTICYASFGGQTAMCLVKVSAKEVQPLLSVLTPYQNGITLSVGDEFDLLLSVKLGEDALDGAQIEYNVSAPKFVTANKGTIIANEVGNATLYVEVTYEGQTASLSIEIEVVSAIS